MQPTERPIATGSENESTSQVNRLQSTEILLPAGDTAAPRAPTRFGDYEVYSEIARGGMGIVFKARQIKLDRVVALKMILPHQLTSESSVRRFYIEAEAAAKLDHPGIVAVHDVGVYDGHHYICMSYVDGENLAGRIKRESLSRDESVRIVRDIAQAVHYAHMRGIIHRDLKPANILIARDGRCQVTDFGLARRMDSSEMPTLPGSVLGTPAFMSPEQADGQNDDVGPASDIYSLGAILFYLLAGRPPFDGKEPLELLRRVREEEPPNLQKLDPSIPIELAAICRNCLSKKPAERPPTAHFLSEELTRVLNRQPIQSALPAADSTIDRTVVPWRGIAGVIGAVLVLIGIPIIWQVVSVPSDGGAHDIAAPGPAIMPPASPTLEGNISIRVWNDKIAGRKGLPITESDVLPLREEDKIRIEALLNRPAYAYVVWIDTNGKASPVHPWDPKTRQWSLMGSVERPTIQLSLPTLPSGNDNELSKAWPITGPAGMETVVLLARETPLPQDVDLSKLFTGFDRQVMHDPVNLVQMDHGRLLADGNRAVKFDTPEVLNDPVFETHRRIIERLEPYFPLIRAISMANEAAQ